MYQSRILTDHQKFRLSFVLQILAHPVGRKSAHPPHLCQGVQ